MNSISRYFAVRILEFIFAIMTLFVFFFYTGEYYWQSGPRSILDTLSGALYMSLLYETLLLYIPITAISWVICEMSKVNKVQFISVPIIFICHAIFVSKLLYFKFNLPVIMAIGALALVDCAIAWFFVVKTKGNDRLTV